MAAAQRLRQGLRAVFAFSQPLGLSLAAAYLSPELLALFRRTNRGEQLHSLNVLQSVLAQGPAPRELAIAALLHDAGKSRYPLAVWQKTLAVLARAAFPALFERWSRGNPASHWHRPFAVYAQHPRWGAELLAEAGAPEAAVWLVEHHADSPAQWSDHPCAALLARLQQADEVN